MRLLTTSLAAALARAAPVCVAFHNQHKSAGVTFTSTVWDTPTVASRLSAHEWKIERGRWQCDHKQWNATTKACEYSLWTRPPPRDLPFRTQPRADHARPPMLLFGGFALAAAELPAFARARCAWLTVYREPLARLVSAFYYCKHSRWLYDPLCASAELDARNATLREFARHWGNYALRDLLLHPPLARRLLPANHTSPQRPDDSPFRNRRSVWRANRRALAGGDDPATAAGRANLDAAIALLRAGTLYDAVGVLERWDETCALFDAAAPLVEPWCEALANHTVDHGSAKWKELELAELARARDDADVRAAIAGDLELYNDAVLPLFEEMQAQRRAVGDGRYTWPPRGAGGG